MLQVRSLDRNGPSAAIRAAVARAPESTNITTARRRYRATRTLAANVRHLAAASFSLTASVLDQPPTSLVNFIVSDELTAIYLLRKIFHCCNFKNCNCNNNEIKIVIVAVSLLLWSYPSSVAKMPLNTHSISTADNLLTPILRQHFVMPDAIRSNNLGVVDYGTCKADLVFVLDSSASIGALDWFRMKQFGIDVIKGTTHILTTVIRPRTSG